MRGWILAALAVASLHAAPVGLVDPASAAEKRVALVVGNGDYSAIPGRPTASADTTAVAAALEEVGFAVTVERDLTRDALSAALAALGERAAGTDWVVFYYSGQAVEADRHYALVPVDADPGAGDAADELVPLDRVFAAGAPEAALVVMLDSGRDNRFFKSAAASSSAPDRIDSRRDVVVMYATEAGRRGSSAGEISPFAAALAEHIPEPGLELGLFLRKVRDGVMARTGGAQTPFTYATLGAERYFVAPQ